MSEPEIPAFLELAVPGIFPLAFSCWLWVRWLRKTRRVPDWLAWFPTALVGVLGMTTLITGHGLWRAWRAFSDDAPSERQLQLARGITQATWASGVGYVLLCGAAAALLVLTLRTQDETQV
jgi:hypothetical protein